MKSLFKSMFGLSSIVVLAASMTINGCKPQETPSMYDAGQQYLPNPVVDSVSPGSYSLSGVGQLTIYGKNFSANVQNDGAFFDTTMARLVSATPTKLVLNTPNVIGDSVKVRVFVLGALEYSPIVYYKMLAAIAPFGGLKGYTGLAVTTDGAGSVFAATNNTAGTASGTFVCTDTSNTVIEPSHNMWSGMKVGPGGYLYMARGARAVFRVPLAGGTAAVWKATPGNVADFDFDQNQVVWAGGNGGNAIYSITQGLTVKSFPFTGSIHSVRVFGTDLYVSAKTDSTEAVWKIPIYSSDSLGTPQKYFDFSAAYPGYSALAISFSSDGDLYIGTDAPEAIVVVHADGSNETLYPGVIQPTVRSLAWGTGNNLYIATSSNVYKVVAPKTGAPYYGLQ